MTRMSSVSNLTLALCLGFGTAACAGESPGVTAELARALSVARGAAVRDKAVWSDVRKVYGARQNAPLWVSEHDVLRTADDALAAIRRAAEHGLDPDRYGSAMLAGEAERLRAGDRDVRTPAALARFDSDLTRAQLALGRDVAVGISEAPPPGAARDGGREAPDVAARFSSIVEAGRLAQWPDDVRPGHAQYASLQAALKRLLSGSRSAADSLPSSTVRASKATPGEPAGPPDRQRIALNLERWRHMPDDLGARYILINIPQFHLWVHEGSRRVHNQRVIVGAKESETPVFGAELNQVVFSPYWNIPDSIAKGEIVPAILRNPAYLTRNDIEVLRRSAGSLERVDPSTVNWRDPDVTRGLSLRQRPGAANALGYVKFLMPNRHSVYLHDTPSDQLFEKAGRAFSHGCIRLAEPFALAEYVLADRPEWPVERIQDSMHSGEEQSVGLSRPIPVHIAYFTAWADEAGRVEIFKDVYHLDRMK